MPGNNSNSGGASTVVKHSKPDSNASSVALGAGEKQKH